MTGPDFALSILASIIAAIVFETCRYLIVRHKLLQRLPRLLTSTNRKILRLKYWISTTGEVYLDILQRSAAKMLPVKKEDRPRPTLSLLQEVGHWDKDRSPYTVTPTATLRINPICGTGGHFGAAAVLKKM